MTIFAVFTTTTKKKLNNNFFAFTSRFLREIKLFFISYYFCFVLCVVAFFLLIRILALSFVWQIGISKKWKVLHWAASCLKLLCWVSAFLPTTYNTTQHNIKYSEMSRCLRFRIFYSFSYFHSFHSFHSYHSFSFISCLHCFSLCHKKLRRIEESFGGRLKKWPFFDLTRLGNKAVFIFLLFLAMSYCTMSKRLEWSIRKIMLLSFDIMMMYGKINFYW
jgi:hypothetical protein